MLKLNKARRKGWERIMRGFFLTRTTCTLFNLGVFDVLEREQPLEPGRFASQHDLDADLLKALCEYMSLMGVFKHEGDVYRLDKRGEFFCSYLRGWFDLVHGYEEPFHHLEDLVRKKRVYGEDLSRRPEHVARGSGDASKLLYFPIVVEMLMGRGYRSVVDFGCGDGTFLIDMAQAIPQIQAFGVDLAQEAVDSGTEKIAGHGLQDRIRLMQGDMLEMAKLGSKLQPVDAATVFFVLHELLSLSRERLIRVLRDFRRHFPGTDLVVCEAVFHDFDELPAQPSYIAEYQLFHKISGQKLANLKTWKEIFRSAGFSSIEEKYLRFCRTVVYILGNKQGEAPPVEEALS
jgi:SAM-dependent methyltransferase